MENISEKLKKNIVKSDAWFLKNVDALPVSKKKTTYERKTDGKVIPVVDVEYTNGSVIRFSENRIWNKNKR